MPVMKGLLAPQNTFLDTIATRFDGTRELLRWHFTLFVVKNYFGVLMKRFLFLEQDINYFVRSLK